MTTPMNVDDVQIQDILNVILKKFGGTAVIDETTLLLGAARPSGSLGKLKQSINPSTAIFVATTGPVTPAETLSNDADTLILTGVLNSLLDQLGGRVVISQAEIEDVKNAGGVDILEEAGLFEDSDAMFTIRGSVKREGTE